MPSISGVAPSSPEHPDLFEQVIEPNFLLGGNLGDLRQAPVGQIDAAVRQLPDRRVVRHHQDRVPFGVQLAQQTDHGFLVRFVEISGRLVRENQLRDD